MVPLIQEHMTYVIDVAQRKQSSEKHTQQMQMGTWAKRKPGTTLLGLYPGVASDWLLEAHMVCDNSHCQADRFQNRLGGRRPGMPGRGLD